MNKVEHVRRMWRYTRLSAVIAVVVTCLIAASLVFDDSGDDRAAVLKFAIGFIAFAAALVWVAAIIRDAIIRRLTNER